MPWAKRITKPIPTIGSRSETYEVNDYSLGFNSFLSNDKMTIKNGGVNFWRLAQNARITSLGEYETRKGIDYHSDAAGETEDQAITSTTGADDEIFDTTNRLAQVFTAGANGSLTKIQINIKNPNGATGVVLVELWSDSGGEPGTLMTTSSIDASDITGSYQYLTARFHEPIALSSATDYWIVAYVQPVGAEQYNWSSTTSATTALTSDDGGSSWATTTFALNFKQFYGTTGGVKGLHRAYKSDGTALTIFAHGTSLYSVNEVTGALTALKTGLSASATHYRFVTINDIVYYVNGFDGLRKLSGVGYATEAQVNANNYTLITQHKGLMFLVEADDPNKVVYSNFADYETFTSTDFIYIPAPKTGDPTVAMVSLNGYLLFFTRDNKFILSGDDNATFTLEEAPDQKGSYTQETTTVDKNFVYYLANDGVYRSNGSEAHLLSENAYEDILRISNRDSATMCVNRGRLYLWFRSEGSATNDSCYVWNLNFAGDNDVMESLDNSTNVGRAVTAPNDDNQLLVANSSIGQAYWQELDSNDYTDVGMPYTLILQTHYMTFASPAVLKEIRHWQPRFGAKSGSYPISCEYAYDLRDNWSVYSTPNVQGAGYLWGDAGTVWGSFTWGSTAELQSFLYVPGEYRRIALRYVHDGVRQPQTFLGHTLVTQTRRIR